MPWTDSDYPESLKNFMAPVRRKAVDIANALLKDGYEEGRAISIATSQAEEWATSRNMQVRKKRAAGTLTAGNGNGSAKSTKSGTKSKAASSTKKSGDSKKSASSKAGDSDSKKSASSKAGDGDSKKSGGKKKSSKKPKTLTTPKFPQ